MRNAFSIFKNRTSCALRAPPCGYFEHIPNEDNKCWFISNNSFWLLYEWIRSELFKSEISFSTTESIALNIFSTTCICLSRRNLTDSTSFDVERSTCVSTIKTRGGFVTSSWLNSPPDHSMAPPYVTIVLSIPEHRPWNISSHLL